MTDPTQLSRILRRWMDVFMHRSMRGWSHQVKATGMSMPQFSILMQLHYKGSCGVSEISERFEVTTAAASQLVDKLVQSNLVERAEDPHDRRARQIQLSTKGKAMIEKGTRERYRWVDQLVAILDAKDREQVAEALTILTNAARELESEKQAA